MTDKKYLFFGEMIENESSRDKMKNFINLGEIYDTEITQIATMLLNDDFSLEKVYKKHGIKTLSKAMELANAYAKFKLSNTKRNT